MTLHVVLCWIGAALLITARMHRTRAWRAGRALLLALALLVRWNPLYILAPAPWPHNALERRIQADELAAARGGYSLLRAYE